MANVITFTKDQTTGRYKYTYVSDGVERVFQINFGQYATNNPADCYVDVKATLDSSVPAVAIAPIDMVGGQNKMFRVDIPSGVNVTIETFLQTENAMYIAAL